MAGKRTSYEQQAMSRFRDVAERYGLHVYQGQGASNRIPVRGKTYFQFGDLRVDMPDSHVVVELESAGGVTNLVKYWYCVEQGLIAKPVRLLHVFRQVSAADYVSHLLLWDFLCGEMMRALGRRFAAKQYTYTTDSDLGSALRDFERLLGGG